MDGWMNGCISAMYLKRGNSDVYRWFACLDQCPWRNDSLADDYSKGSPGVGVVVERWMTWQW